MLWADYFCICQSVFENVVKNTTTSNNTTNPSSCIFKQSTTKVLQTECHPACMGWAIHSQPQSEHASSCVCVEFCSQVLSLNFSVCFLWSKDLHKCEEWLSRRHLPPPLIIIVHHVFEFPHWGWRCGWLWFYQIFGFTNPSFQKSVWYIKVLLYFRYKFFSTPCHNYMHIRKYSKFPVLVILCCIFLASLKQIWPLSLLEISHLWDVPQ